MEPQIETTLARIQTDPASGVAQAFFEQKTTVGDQVFLSPWTSVSWSLADQDNSVTVDGIKLTYAQVSQAVVAIAYQVRATPVMLEQTVPPLVNPSA